MNKTVAYGNASLFAVSALLLALQLFLLFFGLGFSLLGVPTTSSYALVMTGHTVYPIACLGKYKLLYLSCA